MIQIKKFTTQRVTGTTYTSSTCVVTFLDNFVEKFTAVMINGKVVQNSRYPYARVPSAPEATPEQMTALEKPEAASLAIVPYVPTYAAWFKSMTTSDV